jgi:hypothetical protein
MKWACRYSDVSDHAVDLRIDHAHVVRCGVHYVDLFFLLLAATPVAPCRLSRPQAEMRRSITVTVLLLVLVIGVPVVGGP